MTVIVEWSLSVLNLNSWNFPCIFSPLTSWEEWQSSFGRHVTSHQDKPYPWKTSKKFPTTAVLEQNSVLRENKIYWTVSSSSSQGLFSGEKMFHSLIYTTWRQVLGILPDGWHSVQTQNNYLIFWSLIVLTDIREWDSFASVCYHLLWRDYNI